MTLCSLEKGKPINQLYLCLWFSWPPFFYQRAPKKQPLMEVPWGYETFISCENITWWCLFSFPVADLIKESIVEFVETCRMSCWPTAWRNTIKGWKVCEMCLLLQVFMLTEPRVRNSWHCVCFQENFALHLTAPFTIFLQENRASRLAARLSNTWWSLTDARVGFKHWVLSGHHHRLTLNTRVQPWGEYLWF